MSDLDNIKERVINEHTSKSINSWFEYEIKGVYYILVMIYIIR